MGVCCEPPDRVIGLGKFEQYIFRTQPEHHRSGPGDLDLTVYSLRKWASLAAQGNPTVLLMLFAPREEWVKAREPFATELQACRSWFLSKQAGARFTGYLQSQRMRLLGEKSQRTNRPELVEKYGIDTKFAYHAVRLGWQGIELMSTGNITLPMPVDQREFLVAMRTGAMTRGQILDTIDRAEEDLFRAIDTTSLPDRPDRERINEWLISTYQRVWEEGE